VHESEERVLVDARHRRLEGAAADDLDLGEDMVAQDVVEQLAVAVAFDAQIARHAVELADLLLRHQVEQQPGRIHDGELGSASILAIATPTWWPRMLSSSAT
jgi:hypothetical protein